MANCLVTGGCGFIGSHIVQRLLADGHRVDVLDDLSYGVRSNVPLTSIWRGDIKHFPDLAGLDVIFHCAAVSRTPPAIKDPEHCMQVNVMGTLTLLENARVARVPRVVVSSSNVVYGGPTAYKVSKLAVEGLCDVYNRLYGQSVIALRYSNVYGSRLKKGDCAVFASLRDSKEEKGYIEITGDGEQSRDFTHVSDIVEGNILAWNSDYKGVVDLCTGLNTTLNDVAKFFMCPVHYVGERLGDIRHIHQDPNLAKEVLGWGAKIKLEDGIKDIWR